MTLAYNIKLCGLIFKVNKNVKFKVEVYNATAVAVIVNHQWFYLKQGKLRWCIRVHCCYE